jgi:putative nucleotidyltransferase with HDIG domain
LATDTLPTREQALALLHEWVENENLRKHCYAVEIAMRAAARKADEDEARWGLAGLIHDFDWERHPDLERHPAKGVEVLRSLGWPDDICHAVLGHSVHTGVPRDTLMAKTLFACDELCGFLVACTLVTPSKRIDEVKVSSVKKKLKRADFARNVNRDDIVNGAAELGVDLDEHIAFCLEALVEAREPLGL